MPEWTREHDAHITKHCEGYQVAQNEGGTWLYQKPASEHCASHWVVVPFYQHDKNARDRAAEAWRWQVEGREYMVMSGVTRGGQSTPPSAIVWPFTRPPVEVSGEHALLWALYRATGGQE